MQGNRFNRYTVIGVLGAFFLFHTAMNAQFSPGDLSKAHQALDGSQNCTKCHEVGHAISGSKCLDCHSEIRQAMNRTGSFHASAVTAGKVCTDCHKEHLGRNARTVLFDEHSFDHNLTGFTLTGRHASLICTKCHTGTMIRDSVTAAVVRDHPHQSYLGLSNNCADCHKTPHPASFSTNCTSCHSTTTWKEVSHFDHSTTRFPLSGQHTTVPCARCHEQNAAARSGNAVGATRSFSDCTPCHASPHNPSIAARTCRNCHSTAGWQLAVSQPFDHSLTRFQLRGAHRSIRCDQCHRPGEHRDFTARFKVKFSACTDCHADKHNGQFMAAYRNDCASCHTEQAYTPSTYSLRRHSASSFPLSGAHSAVPCRTCHQPGSAASPKFRFASLMCEACHADIHNGRMKQFDGDKGCAACHTPDAWKPAGFNHASTGFPLEGKHASVACDRCHPGFPQVTKRESGCESCHPDRHDGQFSSGGTTQCSTCHTSAGWKPAIFNHQTQSRFQLTGAHRTLECSRCHHTEQSGGGMITRYKPMTTDCASCHTENRSHVR